MKYALIENQPQEASPKLSGICPSCESPVISRCGATNIWHWSHRGTRNCDPWWENETKWHRDWKSHFPKEWQEFVQRAENGEKHIADVRTKHGEVFEFQHSHLKPEERLAREAFYKEMVWVVDGNRRQRDLERFDNELWHAEKLDGNEGMRKLRGIAGRSKLLEEWGICSVPVLFDFGAESLWSLLPKNAKGHTFTISLRRSELIELMLSEKPTVQFFADLKRSCEAKVEGHERYLAWQQRKMGLFGFR